MTEHAHTDFDEERGPCVRSWRWSLVAAHKELNCVNNHRVSWEVDPFTVEPSDETETMADDSTEA